jgi:N6-L-threonylcarbamoyladenine synthase
MSLILGLESSCDETAAALVTSDRRILAHKLAGQEAAHRPYGGVVPEIAARAHVEILPGLVEDVLAEAGIALSEVDAIAATAGPGLIGGVMVGLVTAKGLALSAGKPLVAVNHLEGHALSPMLAAPDLAFPYLLLLVSGGHCQLLLVEGVGAYRRLATTIDDAAGEAFDKAAKLLGLGFPGGPAVERAAEHGDPKAVPLPRPLVGSSEPHFSFAGLKSAVLRARDSGLYSAADIAASFQQAAVDCLVDRTARALDRVPQAKALGRRRRSRRQPGGSGRADGGRRPPRPAVRRSAALALHRQCRDDRLGRSLALRGGAGRRPGGARPRPLAARSRGRAGPRRRGESVKVGIIGGGAWGTALAQVAAEGGETLLWAREPEVVESVNARHENCLFLPGLALDPSIRATGELAGLADARPCSSSLRPSTCAPCCRRCRAPPRR